MAFRRLGLLLAMVGAILVAGTGVVLAQAAGKPEAAERKAAARSSSAQPSAEGRPIPGRYIVVLKDRADLAAQDVGRDDPARVRASWRRETVLASLVPTETR